MGLLGPSFWPAVFIELTACSFFSGYLKDRIFRKLHQNKSDIKTKISHVLASLTEEKRQPVCENIERRRSFVDHENGVISIIGCTRSL